MNNLLRNLWRRDEGQDIAEYAVMLAVYKPDIIVVDFLMPHMTGLEAADTLRRLLPCIPVLIFTMDITDQLVEQAKSVGIKGAVQKSNTKEMMRAVAALLHQKTFFKDKRHIN